MAPPGCGLYEQAVQQFCDAARSDHGRDPDGQFEAALQEFLKSRETPDAARNAAGDLQKDVSKKYSVKKIRGKEIIPDKWVDNIFGNIGNAIAVGNVVFAGSPEAVGMAWFVVKLGLNAIKNNYDLYSLFGNGLTAVTEIMILVPHYDELFHDQGVAGTGPNNLENLLFKDIVATYSAVLDFLFSIKRHVEASRLKHLGHAFGDFFGAGLVKFQAKQDAIFALKKKVLEAGDGVFKGRVSGQLTDVQASLEKSLADIRSFASMAAELSHDQQAILEILQDMKTTYRPKTHWELLKQDFDKNRKALDPIRDQDDDMRTLLERRFAGTTKWIPEKQSYIDWHSKSTNAGLCLTGQAGTGKSVAIASVVSDLSAELGEDAIVCYVSCTGEQNVPIELGDSPLEKVRNSVVFQIYKNAAMDEEADDLLEACNKIFIHPKTGPNQVLSDSHRSSGKSAEEDLPKFVDAIIKLVAVLHRQVLMVIDSIDELSDENQEGLYQDLRAVVNAKNVQHPIKILAGCRSNRPFASNAQNDGITIDLQDGNSEDLKATVTDAVSKMPDWTQSERDEAIAKAIEKAGSRFDYVTSVAIPFLQQPFQRPLSKRLEAIPEGITDLYKHALRGMQSNYVELLRVALLWTLYSHQPVRVKEVMEAYSGVYLGDREAGMANEVTGPARFTANQLELQQIQRAGESFLKIWKNTHSQHIVGLLDADQIQKFCSMEDDGDNHADHQHDAVYCEKCKADLNTAETLTLTKKQVHLKLAIACLKHMNSPLFQKRFILDDYEEDKDSDEDNSEAASDAGDNSPEKEAGGKRAEESASAPAETEPSQTETEHRDDQKKSDSETGNSDTHSEADSDDSQTTTEDGTPDDKEEKKTQSNAPPLDQTKKPEDASESPAVVTTNVEAKDESIVTFEPVAKAMSVTSHDSDDSRENDYDDPSADKDDKANQADDDDDEYDDDWDEDKANALRYEMSCWTHHAWQADLAWTAEEKASSAEWAELISEMDKFAFDNPRAFKRWQTMWDEANDGDCIVGGVKPLHVAGYFSFTYWAEHLIKNRGLDPLEFSGGMNPLQFASMDSISPSFLELMLKQSPTTATAQGTDDTPEWPAMHIWLGIDCSPKIVKLFLQYGVSFDSILEEYKETAMHHIGLNATDPEVVELVMGQEESKRPDINALNSYQNTALHFLVWRRHVPLEVLKAFIKYHANINIENYLSLRPLQAACAWAEPEVVKILLDSTDISDINDPDTSGNTALHSAAETGSAECVRALLEHKAEPNSANKRGRRPLHLAAWHGKLEACKTLIDLGADINAKDRHSRTPFWFACYSKSEKTAQFFLDLMKQSHSISEINSPSKRMRTPLRLAASHGLTTILTQLLEMSISAKVNIKEELNRKDSKLGSTALHRAAANAKLDCVNLLLEHGADPQTVDIENKTPLHIASDEWQKHGTAVYEDVVIRLVELDKETATNYLELPATAAANGSVRVLEKLHASGVDLSRADTWGWTPLALAQRLGKMDAERFLKYQAAWGGALPSRWVIPKALLDSFTLSDTGLDIRHSKEGRFCVVTDKPLPAGLDRFYFEITSNKVTDLPNQPDFPIFAIGFCNSGPDTHKFPGWLPKPGFSSAKSWAHHGDDGGFYANTNQKMDQDEKYGPGDTVGCGVDLIAQKMWFTKNGRKLTFEHVNVSGRLFPVVGFNHVVDISTNFGGKTPFAWASANEQEINEEHSAEKQAADKTAT